MKKQASSSYESVRSADEKVVLVWKDLSFQTVAKDSRRSTFLNPVYNTRHILRGLSGRAESKQLIAIMGPTGCGYGCFPACLRLLTSLQENLSVERLGCSIPHWGL